jgi:glycosyltransferase involved in cell wall biosynthesis
MKRLTIAHVLSSFGLGGQERVALSLAQMQHQAGHSVVALSLASSPEGPLAAAFRASGIDVDSVAKHGPSVDPSLPVRLAKSLASRGVKVVHTHNPHALIYGAPAAAMAGAIAVHTKHGINPDVERRRWLRRAASRFADAYVAVTENLARVALDNQECSAARLHVIPNGIDLSHFAPRPEARERIRAQLGIPTNAWVVGSVGRLSPEKNQALLLQASMPMLDQRRHLVLVGDGPERAALEAQVVEGLREDFVHLTGARDDIADLLAAFDVFALTSSSEGLPLVALEAMAAEVPVLATAVGGLPDVIDDRVTGYLVAPGDAAALTRQLAWLSTRPAQAQMVARCARKTVLERHSLEQMASEYSALYLRLLAARDAPAEASARAASG